MEVFKKHCRMIPFQEFQNLERRIVNKMPMGARTPHNYLQKVMFDALCGIPHEDLRDRKHIVQRGMPDYKSFIIESSSGFERRKFDRVPLRNVQVTFVTADHQIENVEPSDISFGGVGVLLEREVNIQQGQPAGVSMRFGEYKEILVSGEVVNIVPQGIKQRIGLRFEVSQAQELMKEFQQLMAYCLKMGGNNAKKSETKAA